MSGTLCIIIILLARVAQQYTNKRAGLAMPTSFWGNFRYFLQLHGFATLLTAVLLLVTNEWDRIDLPTLGISALSGVMLVVVNACILYSVKEGTLVLVTMFSSAGVIIPCLAGIVLYDERMSLIQWVGLGLFLVSSYLLIGDSKKSHAAFSAKSVLLLIGALLSNGIVMLLQTVFSRTVVNGSVTAFSFLSFLIPILLLAAIMLGMKLRNPEECREPADKKLIWIALVSAVALFAVNQFATIAANQVEPVVLFTFINGGNTIIAAGVDALMFRQKPTVKGVIGILVGILAMILVKAF